MARYEMRAGAVLQTIVLWLVAAGPSFGADQLPFPQGGPAGLDLFHLSDTPAARVLSVGGPGGDPRHRFYLELAGARSQAEDWARDAGFLLLEDRDGEGRRTYQLISGTLASEWTPVSLHARLGLPQLSAGLRQRREVPAFGASIPWQRCALEIEALQDRGLGWAVMSRFHWSDARQRLEYGVALPLKIAGSPSVGVLLQLRVRWGQ